MRQPLATALALMLASGALAGGALAQPLPDPALAPPGQAPLSPSTLAPAPEAFDVLVAGQVLRPAAQAPTTQGAIPLPSQQGAGPAALALRQSAPSAAGNVSAPRLGRSVQQAARFALAAEEAAASPGHVIRQAGEIAPAPAVAADLTGSSGHGAPQAGGVAPAPAPPPGQATQAPGPAPAAQPPPIAPPTVPPTVPPPTPLRPLRFSQLPGWLEDHHAEALPALLAGCETLAAGQPARALGGAEGPAREKAGSAAAWVALCAEAVALEAALRPRPGRRPPARAILASRAMERDRAVRIFLERRLQPYLAGEGLLTGYYEPELRGATAPAPPFTVPLLALPATPERPLPDRAAIEDGALAGQGLELVWVDDATDAFFLHIQGSGRVTLAGGGTLRLGYAGQNGHPYFPIGRALLEQGAIPREQLSMQSIRAWLAAASPGDAAALRRRNPAYVFFRPLEGLSPEQGPPGAFGAPLTPGRSLAVDPRFIPYAAPVFVATREPLSGAPWRRLLLAQDTGGAIRGPARGDVFWGWGADAAERAGRMRESAMVFLLLPRGSVRP